MKPDWHEATECLPKDSSYVVVELSDGSNDVAYVRSGKWIFDQWTDAKPDSVVVRWRDFTAAEMRPSLRSLR